MEILALSQRLDSLMDSWQTHLTASLGHLLGQYVVDHENSFQDWDIGLFDVEDLNTFPLKIQQVILRIMKQFETKLNLHEHEAISNLILETQLLLEDVLFDFCDVPRDFCMTWVKSILEELDCILHLFQMRMISPESLNKPLEDAEILQSVKFDNETLKEKMPEVFILQEQLKLIETAYNETSEKDRLDRCDLIADLLDLIKDTITFYNKIKT